MKLIKITILFVIYACIWNLFIIDILFLKIVVTIALIIWRYVLKMFWQFIISKNIWHT